MKHLSQNNKKIVDYVVCWGDWLSTDHSEVDDRTTRSRSFSDESGAIEFAEKILKERSPPDDKWLAYVVIKKRSTKIIKKLK